MPRLPWVISGYDVASSQYSSGTVGSLGMRTRLLTTLTSMTLIFSSVTGLWTTPWLRSAYKMD